MCNHDIKFAAESQGDTRQKLRDVLNIARDKRLASLRAAQLIERHVSIAAHVNMLHCGDVLTMLEDDDGSNKRLKSAYFCGQRLCPACAYRASLATAVSISAITGALLADGRIGLMVTVTAPNCTGDQLGAEILRYNRAWNKLLHLKAYKDAWSDHIRKMEVTYNAQADTYHPHIHALVYVRPGYFKGAAYISRDRLLRDWRRCYGDDRITQVDIRKTHGQDWQAISELAKYVAKSGDYLHSQQVFDAYYIGLKGKRISGYAGRCKELRAEYRAGRLNEYVERDLTRYVWEVIYTDYQHSGSYIEETRRPYDAVIMGDDDIPTNELYPLYPPEWDELAD